MNGNWEFPNPHPNNTPKQYHKTERQNTGYVQHFLTLNFRILMLSSQGFRVDCLGMLKNPIICRELNIWEDVQDQWRANVGAAAKMFKNRHQTPRHRNNRKRHSIVQIDCSIREASPHDFITVFFAWQNVSTKNVGVDSKVRTHFFWQHMYKQCIAI